MYVHFMTGKPFRDSRIRGITPSHHPSRDREDGRSSFINPASPLGRHHRCEEGGPRRRCAPLFPAVGTDVRRWLGNCGLAVPTRTHAHRHNPWPAH